VEKLRFKVDKQLKGSNYTDEPSAFAHLPPPMLRTVLGEGSFVRALKHFSGRLLSLADIRKMAMAADSIKV
jgi:hypothetical protein